MSDEYTTCAALLHDVAEDTDITLDELRKQGIPEAVTDALRLLIHDKAVPYLDYVARLKRNPIARRVKQADLRHNMDTSRLVVMDEAAQKRVKKYQQALALLETD